MFSWRFQTWNFTIIQPVTPPLCFELKRLMKSITLLLLLLQIEAAANICSQSLCCGPPCNPCFSCVSAPAHFIQILFIRPEKELLIWNKIWYRRTVRYCAMWIGDNRHNFWPALWWTGDPSSTRLVNTTTMNEWSGQSSWVFLIFLSLPQNAPLLLHWCTAATTDGEQNVEFIWNQYIIHFGSSSLALNTQALIHLFVYWNKKL